MRRALLLVLILLLLPVVSDARSGVTAGVSHRNCATTEPTINAAATTVLCDDFELKGDGTTPGAWYQWGCDNPPPPQLGGEENPGTKGWCGQPSSVQTQIGPFTTCSGAGTNGTACTARSVLNGDAEAHASHSFQTTCTQGGLNCQIINGVAHYDEIYVRFYIKFLVGWQAASSQNQKLITINPHGNGTGGILLAGMMGMPNDNGTLVNCPVLDCNVLSDNYKNPQANGFGDLCGGSSFPAGSCIYLGQNAGNGVIDVIHGRLGRWTCVEGYMRLNTPDVQNGLFKMWANDGGTDGTLCTGVTPTLRSNYTNIRYRGAQANNSSLKIGMVFLDTWTGGLTAGSGSHGTIQIDQVVVSTQPIGWMGSSPTPPPNAFSLAMANGAHTITGAATTLTQIPGPTLIGFVHRAAILVVIIAAFLLIRRRRNASR